MNSIELPKIELTDNEKTWLRESWTLLQEGCVKPQYRTIRVNTVNETHGEFNPLNIAPSLIVDNATRITLYGVLQIEPGSDIMKHLDQIMLHIKKQLLEDIDRVEFNLYEIASELKLEQRYVRLIFQMLCDYINLWSSASATDNNIWGFEKIKIEYPRVIDNYFNYSSIEKIIADYFIAVNKSVKEESEQDHNSDIFWVDGNGDLIFNEDVLLDKIKNFDLLKRDNFIAPSRIVEIEALTQKEYDLSKLLVLCRELNVNYSFENYYSVAMLTRSLMDHVPPVFGHSSFKEVANNYKSEKNTTSFKKSMGHLENEVRNICDSHIHSQIRKNESLPNEVQVNFKNSLDIMLGELVRILK